MHPVYVALNNTVNWCMVAWYTQNLCEDGISFKWHQPCNNQNSCKYSTLKAIENALCKATVTQFSAVYDQSAVSLLEAENSGILKKIY